MTKQIELSQLKALSPLDSLKKDNLHALVKKTKIREAQPGETLFREGDSEKRTVYVLSGSVELREGEQTVAKITGGTDDARNPLALILSAIFWGTLWGPIGLLLSTPLTICLLVVGKHVPHLGFLEVLLGAEPALATRVTRSVLVGS